MREYFVYESWTRDGVRVHDSGCTECCDGTGHNGVGKWHGPYRDRGSAFKFAANLRHIDTRACDSCLP